MLRQTLILAASVALLAACAEKKEEVAVAEPPPQARQDCYTVQLFDDHPIVPPAEEVPAEHARYLGKWEQGAWNGKWCHDILVTEVKRDGTVKLVEMHAPYEPWGQPATAFERTARIDEEGRIRLRYGTESISYELAGNGKLLAQRSGIHGDLVAMLEQDGYVPLPLSRPGANVAQSGSWEEQVEVAVAGQDVTPKAKTTPPPAKPAAEAKSDEMPSPAPANRTATPAGGMDVTPPAAQRVTPPASESRIPEGGIDVTPSDDGTAASLGATGKTRDIAKGTAL